MVRALPIAETSTGVELRLALVGDSRPVRDYEVFSSNVLWASQVGRDPRYRIVTICPPSGRAAILKGLPGALQIRNAFEWTRTPIEAVPLVLGAADLIYKDYRVFINYRQGRQPNRTQTIFLPHCPTLG